MLIWLGMCDVFLAFIHLSLACQSMYNLLGAIDSIGSVLHKVGTRDGHGMGRDISVFIFIFKSHLYTFTNIH